MFQFISSLFQQDQDSAADVYIDLGTANTLVAVRGQGVIINEPSLVAFTEPAPRRRKIIGVGLAAQDKMDKNPGNVIFQKPVRDGVIADFDSTQVMLKHFLNEASQKAKVFRPRVVVSLPFGVTEVEKKAVIAACSQAGARRTYLIDEPMATAIGAGLPVKDAKGCMIVDIGGGTTEVAVIALADIVYCEPVKLGGHKFDEAILHYFKNEKQLNISEKQAEELKIELGTALPKRNITTKTVTGRDVNTGLVRTVEVSSQEIGAALHDSIQMIINAIHTALENTPPELVSDIIETSIVLAGGGALIRDLDVRIKNEVRLDVCVADNPLTAIAKGGEMVLSDPKLLEKIQVEV